MGSNITLNPRGLFTSYNRLSQVDPGGLLKANNLNINEKGILKPRRGIKYYSSLFPVATDRARQLLEYKGRIISHIGNKLAFDNGHGIFTNFYGNYSDASSDVRIKGIEFKGNFYLTSDSGVKKISASSVDTITSNSIMDTGAPIAEGMNTSIVAYPTGFLAAQQHTSYRVTWGYNDNNGLFIEGVPSGIVTVDNNTDYQKFAVDCQIFIPSNITTSYFFRLYRTETRPHDQALSTEFRLVFQGNPTNAEITQGYLNYTDALSEDFRNAGVALYSNPNSGDGPTSLNYPPPLATDITLYRNHIFYANTKFFQTKVLTLQSTADFTSGVSNFIITNGSVTRTYTFQGQAEISTAVIQPASFYTDGDYFLLNSANNFRRYFVYLKKTSTTTVPTNPDTVGRIGIPVDISTLHTNVEVANAIATTIDALNDFYGSSQAILVSSSPALYNAVLTIENTENGYSDATADSIYQPTNLVFTTFQQGIGENLSQGKPLLQESQIYTELELLEVTAQSLVNCINFDNQSFVTALYLGKGQISLIAKSFNQPKFYTTTTDVDVVKSWFPNLSPVNDPSDESKQLNAIYFSKPDEPESVPIFNSILVGSSDEPILRIVALRESLFIFKTDGLFRLTGYTSQDFSVYLFDSTAILKAPDSAAVLRNQIYYFGTQGVSRVSEGGSEKLSNPIDNKLQPFITTCADLDKLTFGVAYETDQSYMLWTCLKSTDTIAQVAYRYNLYTDTWTEWKISKTCVVLNSNEDKLYFGSGDAPTLEVERKSFDRFDYCDREINITLPSLSIIGNVIKPSGASQIEAGDVLFQLQTVTVSQFNQILTMLETDPSFPVNNFNNYKINAGESMSVKIGSLVGYLNSIDTNHFIDSHGHTSYISTGTSNIFLMQLEWFAIIDRLNQSPTFFLSNYPKYNKLTPIEARVVSRDITNNDIYLELEYPFIEGDLILYKSIVTEVEFVPQTAGDPASLKQFQSCQVIFEHRSINTAQVGFSSDLSADTEYVQFSPNSSGIWGNFSFGDSIVWGGDGDQAPLRTYVPRRKQRCRYIGLSFKHTGALESFNLYGLSLSYVDSSDRAYK